MWRYRNTDEIYHHGVIGMRWGIRRLSLSGESDSNYKRKSSRSSGTTLLDVARKSAYNNMKRTNANQVKLTRARNYIQKNGINKYAGDFFDDFKAFSKSGKHSVIDMLDDKGTTLLKEMQNQINIGEKIYHRYLNDYEHRFRI